MGESMLAAVESLPISSINSYSTCIIFLFSEKSTAYKLLLFTEM